MIGAGVTLNEAIKAHKTLQSMEKQIRVLDLFSVKPIDHQAILNNAQQCGNKVLVVEDHYVEGGIFGFFFLFLDAVCACLASKEGIKVY